MILDIKTFKKILGIPMLLMNEFQGSSAKGKDGIIFCDLLAFDGIFLQLERKENIGEGISVLYVKNRNDVIAEFIVDIRFPKSDENAPEIYSKIHEFRDSTSPEALTVYEMNRRFAAMKAEVLKEIRRLFAA